MAVTASQHSGAVKIVSLSCGKGSTPPGLYGFLIYLGCMDLYSTELILNGRMSHLYFYLCNLDMSLVPLVAAH